MAVTRCENGHFFDDEKFAECPHCLNSLPNKPKRGIGDAQTIWGASAPNIASDALSQPMRIDWGSSPSNNKQDEKTVGIFRSEKGYDPVVGWLVCIEGKEKGRDFRLFAGRNFIGRAIKCDIALVDDERVSREDHCSLVFEPNHCAFLLAKGTGDGVLVNGERLADSCQLYGDEEIEIGSSQFIFVPFCREGRSW